MKSKNNWSIIIPQQNKPSENEGKPLFIQIIEKLNTLYQFRYNEVNMKVELNHSSEEDKWHEVTDNAFHTLIVQMGSLKLPVTKSTLDSIFKSKYIRRYNPFKAYFKSLPQWDGKDYIKELSETIKSDDDIKWGEYLKKWLVGMVRGATDDRVTNQLMLIFYGKQGIGKTRWFLKLLPPELQQYFFTGHSKLDDQVFGMKLGTYILIFLDELDTYKGNKQALLKSIITQDIIKFRPLFNTFDIEIKRRASFAAAINKEDFLNDLSGSRRFLVIETITIDHNHKLDMNKVFSQAYSYSQDPEFVHYLTQNDIDELEGRNDRFRVKSEAEQLIEKFLQPAGYDVIGAEFMTATDVLNYIQKNADIKINSNASTIGEIMKSLGFKRIHSGSGKLKRSGYEVCKKD